MERQYKLLYKFIKNIAIRVGIILLIVAVVFGLRWGI